MNQAELQTKTIAELYELAKQHGIPSYRKYKKSELIELLQQPAPQPKKRGRPAKREQSELAAQTMTAAASDTKTPVVYISQLKDCIMSYAQELIPRQDIALIYNRICNLNLDGKTVENQHIRSIGDRFIEREATIQQGKCPRCGGALKLRNGKYGAFYGCSNYPKCRFTYNMQSR